MSQMRNPQCPPTTPFLDPPPFFADTLLIEIGVYIIHRLNGQWAEGPPISPPQELESDILVPQILIAYSMSQSYDIDLKL